ncbi:hypothetical protein MKY34_13325 [Sporosarcina sp. FSL K6-1522]|uniref:hypothetical protein n=1 Tax=Sporosarcina sp. FSL K6-1522 TaxID=2921554 RepID=UPI003159B63D
MDLAIILLIIGLISTLASFFVGNSSSKHAEEIEKISISLHQETHNLKKRLKVVEEELMIGVGHLSTPLPKNKKTTIKAKPVHDIIVNQILSLHEQGYSTADIAKRSSLSTNEVLAVLRSKGVMA